MLRQLLLTTCIISTVLSSAYPGPELKPTSGEVWPKPKWQEDTGQYYQLDPQDFVLVVVNQECDLLQRALFRYTRIIEEAAKSPIRVETVPTLSIISCIEVNLTSPCETRPYYGMDESYYVYGNGRVVAHSIWGILRGLETLSQLLVPMKNGKMRIADTEIYDKPRFKYRGIMLDTARHFISLGKILQLLDGMVYNKFNVFHWHMTDDSAFPYNSTKYPELSRMGAFCSTMTYSNTDIALIVDYAKLRGIRVIPEMDIPAHTASWGISHPEVLTDCYGENKGTMGPLNPTVSPTYYMLDDLFREIRMLFPDTFIHLGGDEVDTECWESNPIVQKYLKEERKEVDDLPYVFWSQVTCNITKMERVPIVWQDVVEDNPGIDMPTGTMVQVWFDSKKALPSLTKKGYSVIVSDGFYLYTADDEADWTTFYDVEPTDFAGCKAQKNRVVGGEACLWTEWVNDHNVISVTFPRAMAVAERLWSEKKYKNVNEAARRLEEQNCRMLWRGIETKPANGYGLC